MIKDEAYGFAKYASEFFEAALDADDKMGLKPGYELMAPVPVMYLVGHSIELSLKAFLLHKGISINNLKRKIGHNLIKAYKKAKEMGLDEYVQLSSADLRILELINNLYASKQLNYVDFENRRYPVFGPLELLNRKLLRAICPLVDYVHT